MPDLATLRVIRSSSWRRDIFRRYEVLVDDMAVGSLRRGQTLDRSVEPGEHRVSMKIDWKRSNELHISLTAGEVAALLCEPRSLVRAVADLAPGRPWIDIRRAE